MQRPFLLQRPLAAHLPKRNHYGVMISLQTAAIPWHQGVDQKGIFRSHSTVAISLQTQRAHFLKKYPTN
ncbi:hypothetical protein CU664_22215 [Pseudomonas syringae pv. actinidifoliorum]|nr:hypothetical protein [Pseudomonas syringae pv. actinidifoliorum]NAT65801.1 hypothetical protein [Pseudomonas syringae pv. actinidifoliorum]